MCGRCACTRDPGDVQRACAFRPKTTKTVAMPKWAPSSLTYHPSYNVSPQTPTPLLISGHHPHLKSFLNDNTELESEERVLQIMKWGLVPCWHRAGSDLPLLNNCRSDGMMQKVSFRHAVQRGQRCVVLADGYFEWQQQKGNQKQPFFLQFSENGPTADMCELSVEMKRGEVSDDAKLSPAKFTGRMLTMAGLFDIWKAGGKDDPLYTYAVITVDAHPTVGHIHERMPAVLDGDDEVERWLCPDNRTEDVLDLIRPCGALSCHPVSHVVNNVRNKSAECVLAIDPSKQISCKQNTLLNWFSHPAKTSKEEPCVEQASKKSKLF